MKATTWLCPILTLLCATRLACTAQRGSGTGSGNAIDYGYGYAYPLDYLDTNLLQDDYMLEKRNKPSLSIVNPLDVLRQRLLLEIARRQMKENTRQVELNRAILKNVGKRSARRYRMSAQQQPSTAALLAAQQYQEQLLQPHHYYPTQQHQQQQQQQQQQRQHLQHEQLDVGMPPTSIFDFLQQRPGAFGLETLLDDEKKSLDDVGSSANKHQVNGNEIGNETNHGNNNHNNNNNNNNNNGDNMDSLSAMAVGRLPVENNERMLLGSSVGSGGNGGGDGGGSGGVGGVSSATGSSATNGGGDGGGSAGGVIFVDENNADDLTADDTNNAGYHQMRYLYRLHKNHFARK